MLRTFIIIDDDLFSNTICSHVIKKHVKTGHIEVFANPEKGLKFLVGHLQAKDENDTVYVFLDINMPGMSGWELLKLLQIQIIPDTEHLKIFMLSSSLNDKDRDQAKSNNLVSEYILKPFTKEKLFQIMGE